MIERDLFQENWLILKEFNSQSSEEKIFFKDEFSYEENSEIIAIWLIVRNSAWELIWWMLITESNWYLSLKNILLKEKRWKWIWTQLLIKWLEKLESNTKKQKIFFISINTHLWYKYWLIDKEGWFFNLKISHLLENILNYSEQKPPSRFFIWNEELKWEDHKKALEIYLDFFKKS